MSLQEGALSEDLLWNHKKRCKLNPKQGLTYDRGMLLKDINQQSSDVMNRVTVSKTACHEGFYSPTEKAQGHVCPFIAALIIRLNLFTQKYQQS